MSMVLSRCERGELGVLLAGHKLTVAASVLMLAGAALIGALAEPAEATHFRYRVLSWERVDDREVEFTLLMADRASFYGSVETGQEWSEPIDFGDGSSGTMTGTVLSVNTTDDWFIAEVTARHVYDDDGPHTVEWESCCTISELNNSANSSLRSFSVVDLSDGNAGSPVAAVEPIQAVQPDSDELVDIPLHATDPTGGEVTWRLAEPGEVLVDQPPGASIDEETGRIAWDVDGLADGLYLFTAMVGDKTGSETQVTFLADLGGEPMEDPLEWIAGPRDGSVLTPFSSLVEGDSFELVATSHDDRDVTILPTALSSNMECEDVDNPAPEARIACDVDWSGSEGVWEPAQFTAHTPDGQRAPRRTYTVGNSTYAALGDSYQSGEGIADYYDHTNEEGVNECRRSPLAYPELLTDRAAVPGGSRLRFAACSGAETKHVVDDDAVDPSGVLQWPGENDVWEELRDGEDAVQEVTVDRSTSLITIGVGGNDVGFSEVLLSCITRNRAAMPDWDWGDVLAESTTAFPLSCERGWGETVPERIDDLVGSDIASRSRLERVYRSVTADTPAIGSELVVLGYPRLFPEGGSGLLPCWGVRNTEQRWMNDMGEKLGDGIEREALAVGARFVDLEGLFDGHEVCGDDNAYLNGVRGLPGFDGDVRESFHPNATGHDAIADALADELADRGEEFLVFSDATVEHVIEVSEQTLELLQLVLRWPGSDVVLTVESPDGSVYGRGEQLPDDKVAQDNGPRHDALTIADPEPGEWTVRMYGADVGTEGTPVELEVAEVEHSPEGPTAAFDLEVDGAEVAVDAAPSQEGDAPIVAYEWEFGEPAVAPEKGEQATHTYERAASWEVTLLVEDANGEIDLTSSETVVVTEDDLVTHVAQFDEPEGRPMVGRTNVVRFVVFDADDEPTDDVDVDVTVTDADDSAFPADVVVERGEPGVYHARFSADADGETTLTAYDGDVRIGETIVEIEPRGRPE